MYMGSVPKGSLKEKQVVVMKSYFRMPRKTALLPKKKKKRGY